MSKDAEKKIKTDDERAPKAPKPEDLGLTEEQLQQVGGSRRPQTQATTIQAEPGSGVCEC